MEDAVEATRRTLATLRTGRAAPEMLDRVLVEAYGSKMALAQVAQVGVQQPRGLVVTPHDPSLLAAVERALRDADLGAQPSSDGIRVRLDLPAPSGERRAELAKVASRDAEAGRIAVRNARRDAINELRRQCKAGDISEARLNGTSKRLQTLTDEHVAKVDELLATTLAVLQQ